MSKPEWDKFGNSCDGSRWFNVEPIVTERLVQTYGQLWMCPVTPCDGEMRYTGRYWPTGTTGYHHTCNKCGFTAAVNVIYPRTVTRWSPRLKSGAIKGRATS